MNRKTIWLVVSLLIISSLLIGVFGCEAPITPPSPTATSTPTPALTPVSPTPTSTQSPSPSPAQPKVIKWTGQNAYFPGTATKRFPGGYSGSGDVANLFVDWVKKITKGQLIIEMAPPDGIVPVANMLTAVEKGTLDFAGLMYGGYYTGIIPEADIEIGLPFAWETSEEISDALYNWGLYDEFVKIYAEHNIWPAIFANSCLYQVGSTTLISKPEDLKGKKIRALGIYGNFVNSFGGSAVNIPKGELYMALKLGTIDGYILGPSGLEENKLKEVTKYYVVSPNMNTIGGNFLFNQKSLDALPPDIKELIQINTKYVVRYWADQFYMASLWTVYNSAKEGYVTVVNWPADAAAKAREVGVGLWDSVAAKSARCAKLVDIVKAQARDLRKIK